MYNIKDQIYVLGMIYKILVVDYKDDKYFEAEGCDGYCDGELHEIVICNLKTHPSYENENNEKSIEMAMKFTLRHEIVHAFLNESGLKECSGKYAYGWARNEEMVDWMATQIAKIYFAFKEAGAI